MDVKSNSFRVHLFDLGQEFSMTKRPHPWETPAKKPEYRGYVW